MVAQSATAGPILTSDEFLSLILQEWSALDKSDSGALDQFIERFPFAELGSVAFATRYTQVRASGDVAMFNTFIAKYPDRLFTYSAIGDLFQLYLTQNRVSGYMDFTDRYPSVPETVLARARIAAHMFNFAALVDTESVYDEYAEQFPDAPYTIPAMKRAVELRVEQERARVNGGLIPDANARVQQLSNAYVKLRNPITAAATDRDVRRASRIEAIIDRVYTPDADEELSPFLASAQDAVGDFQGHRQLLRIEQRLVEIEKRLTDNQARTETLLREEFSRTRDDILKAVQQLEKSIGRVGSAVTASLRRISDSMDAALFELRQANTQLTVIGGTLTEIRDGIKRSNEFLAGIESHVIQMRGEIREVAQGVGDLGRKLDANQKEQIKAIAGLTETVKGGFKATVEANTRVLSSLETLNRQTAVNAAQTIAQLQTMNAGIQQLDSSMTMGFKQLDGSLQVVAQQTRGGGPAEGTLGGMLGSLAGSFLPGVGPMMGPFLGNLAESVIRGENPSSALVDSAVTALGTAVPGSERFARPMVQYARGEHRQAIESARAMLPGMRDQAVEYAASYVV